MTTHSPFVLNYINVLLKRFYKKVDSKATICPEELSVFATQDGRLVDLMQKNTATGEWSVNAEDLVEVMRTMLQEYRELKEM